MRQLPLLWQPLQQDNWVGEIGQGLTTVSVVVQQPPVTHEVKMKDFLSWLGRQGGSPAEIILREKVGKMLGMANQARKYKILPNQWWARNPSQRHATGKRTVGGPSSARGE